MTSKTVVEQIIEKADASYCEGLRLAQQSLCLGADWKMTHGEFTRENLQAHITSAEKDAWHRALHWAAKLIRESAPVETTATPVAWRYKDSRGHWRYTGSQPKPEHEILQAEPLYATRLES